MKMTPDQALPQGASEFVEQVAAAIVEVLEASLGIAVKASGAARAGRRPEATESAAFAVSGALSGVLTLALDPADAIWAARRFVGLEDDATADPSPDDREALDELWRQVMGPVAAALKSGVGEVRFELLDALGTETAAAVAALSEFDCGGRLVAVAVTLDSRLEQTLALAEGVQASVETGEPAASNAPAGTLMPGLRAENLELLLNVELPATLRFGQKQMRLSEIMLLSAGAVIDLDREVHEPVELLVDGRLIARGEAVIVDGNYGLRVTELATQAARLAALP